MYYVVVVVCRVFGARSTAITGTMQFGRVQTLSFMHARQLNMYIWGYKLCLNMCACVCVDICLSICLFVCGTALIKYAG